MADPRLFALYAGFNACGYDEENLRFSKPFPASLMSLPRLQARRYLKKRQVAVHPFCRFLAAHQQPWYVYSHYAMALSAPPHFTVDWTAFQPSDQKYLKPMEGLGKQLARLYRDATLADLWNKQFHEYEKDIAYYRKHAEKWIEPVQQKLADRPREGKIVIIPNLLESHSRADVKKLDKVSYILTPPRQPGRSQQCTIVHEYLHLITRPIVGACIQAIRDRQALYKKVAHLPEIRQNYHTLFLWADEMVVHALTLFFAGPPSGIPEEKWLDSLVVRGYFLVPDLYRGAKATLQTPTRLADALPKIFESVKPDLALQRYEKSANKRMKIGVRKESK
jgi:hypothetical protein